VGRSATPVADAGVTFRVDAHLHLWNLEAGGYGWLGPQHGPLHRSFSAEEARQELATSGVDRAILVQADDTLADTRAMLDAAHNNDWIAGVVGWIRLDAPEEAVRQLHDWLDEPGFCGIRHLVHGDPRDDFLALPAVRESLKGVAAAGIPFDVPDAWPRHLSAAVDLAEAIPELTVIIDHLGKPPLGTRDETSWRDQLARCAALPNTVAKVSGLRLPGVPYTAAALGQAWDAALEIFGPGRLMYGGDWPVSTLGGNYADTLAVLQELIGTLDPIEAVNIWSGTARRTYGHAIWDQGETAQSGT
jgi:L-fuconolactonase